MRYEAIIIGAGIAGLVAAYQLAKAGRRVLLIEYRERVGGVIETIDADGFLLERGPNSLRGTHEFLDLVDELGLGDELVKANPRAPAYVVFQDELHPVPMSPGAAVTTKLLSFSGKMRLLREPFIKPSPHSDDESIASFIRRRLGPEVLDRLVSPFVSGVYAGDVERLSVQSCFARLAEFEADAGSIARGVWRAVRHGKKSAAGAPRRSLRPYRLCSFRHGLSVFPQAIARALGSSVLTETQIERIDRLPITDGPTVFEIEATHHDEQLILYADNLIVATPADVAARLLAGLSPKLAEHLQGIPYNSLVSVSLAYPTMKIRRPLDGFGFLAPRSEGLRTLGSIWNTSLFTDRAPEGWALLTNFIGGMTDPEAVRLPDEELRKIVHADLKKVLGIDGEPRLLPLTRYRRAIPQYVIGHATCETMIRDEMKHVPGLNLLGNYLGGVSIGDCIRHAIAAAETINKQRA
jgi:oxygen-dependent protoporphyrinogen oxidase